MLSAKGEENPAFAWELNMDSLINVLEIAKEKNLDKIYWPSSIAVFGPTTPKINTRQKTIMEPSTVYGISKQTGERWCEYYYNSYGVDVRSIRYPGLISWSSPPGGGTTDYAVDIFHKAIAKKKYDCFLSSETKMPMMYMDDAIAATIQIMQSPKEQIKISVQFLIRPDHVYDAFYKLQNPHEQITAFIFDVVRAEVPKMILDDVFEKKEEIALAIQRDLKQAMLDYGYDIIKALVTDIDPDEKVKIAMNRINAADREKIAAQHEGDAQRILIVERAKAEAESKRLQGKGIADQRREIARGLEESVVVLNRAGINSQEASALIIITQHYDTLQSIGADTKSNLILLPNNPNAASTMLNDMVTSLVAANKINESSHEIETPKKSKK